MRSITRYSGAAVLALALAGGGYATGQAAATPPQPKIPTSCVAPLGHGQYKMVADGDAERYDNTVDVCVKGRWVEDPDYGQ